MPNPKFSEHLLNLIEEDDRLIGLVEAIDIRLEEDPVNNQWVFVTSPRRDFPLPLTPVTHYGVDIDELDTLIRRTWGEIAQLAKDTSKESIQDLITDLALLAPENPIEQPSFETWIPTQDPDGYESVRTVLRWNIDQHKITPSYEALQLVRSEKRYKIIDPTGRMHPIQTDKEKYPSKKKHTNTDTLIPFNVKDRLSMDAAFEIAREKGLKELKIEQHQKLKKLERRTRLFSFLDGLTIFTGVVAFLFFFIGAHMVLPYVGPVLYTIAVLFAYNH